MHVAYFGGHQRFWLEEPLDWLTVNSPILFVDQMASTFDFRPATEIINPSKRFSPILISLCTRQMGRIFRDKAAWTRASTKISDAAE